MPLSVFRGRVVEPGEPLWLESDRDWALALHLEESSTCSCGEPRAMSMSRDGDGAYAAEVVVCHACAAMARAARKYADSNGGADGAMTRIVVRPKEG